MKPTNLLGAAGFIGLVLLVAVVGGLAIGASEEATRSETNATQSIEVVQDAYLYLNASRTPRATGTGEIAVFDSNGTALEAGEDYEYNASRLRLIPATCADQGLATSDGCPADGETITVEYRYSAPPEPVAQQHGLRVKIMQILPLIAFFGIPVGMIGVFAALKKYGVIGGRSSGRGFR